MPSLDGITEGRAGVSPFHGLLHGLFQAGLASCEIDDIALSVRTSVIGRQRGQHRLMQQVAGMGWECVALRP